MEPLLLSDQDLRDRVAEERAEHGVVVGVTEPASALVLTALGVGAVKVLSRGDPYGELEAAMTAEGASCGLWAQAAGAAWRVAFVGTCALGASDAASDFAVAGPVVAPRAAVPLSPSERMASAGAVGILGSVATLAGPVIVTEGLLAAFHATIGEAFGGPPAGNAGAPMIVAGAALTFGGAGLACSAGLQQRRAAFALTGRRPSAVWGATCFGALSVATGAAFAAPYVDRPGLGLLAEGLFATGFTVSFASAIAQRHENHRTDDGLPSWSRFGVWADGRAAGLRLDAAF